MNEDTFVSFEEYKNKLMMPTNISQRPAEEILKEAYEIRKKIKGSVTTSKT